MELTWRVIVLLVASLATTMCKAHPYGVKGGSSGGNAGGASAAAVAGAGAVSGLGGPDAGSGSGSFSGSISKSASSSYAAATSGSFSFSGSGAGPFSGLGSNLFNFPLNSGCATGKCETGDAGNQFGLGPNSAGSISGAGAGSFALPGAPDLNNKHPCSGDCLNKQPLTCQGSQCQYPVSISENPEPNDISVNVGNKQVPEATEKSCQTENCNSSPNHESKDINPEQQNSETPSSNPSTNNNLPNINVNSPQIFNNPDLGSYNHKLPNPYDSPPNQQTSSTSQNNPGNFPPLNKPLRACDNGKCKENSATSPNIGTVYNPSTPSSFNNAPLCSNGNCGSVQKTKTSYFTPTYKTPTAQNNHFPCNTGNCKSNPNNIPNQPSFNYPASSSSEEELVYTGGFGGPSGILRPNDYTAPLPSISDQSGSAFQALPSLAQMPNNPGNYNSHPNPSDANSPNLENYPSNKPLSPKDTPQSPPDNGNLPNASPQNPTTPSSYGTPGKAPYNNMKTPLPNKSFPVPNEAPTNALPEPSRLLTTPKESFPQTPENDDLYSPYLPSSYHVPIIPNEDSEKPSSNNNNCNSPKCKNKASTPSLLDTAPSASNPACAFGACNLPEKNTPNYPSSQGQTPDAPILATSTINVQLSDIPIESPDDSPDFDVRYTSSNCVNGNCAKETSSNNDNYPFSNHPNSQDPSFKPNLSSKPCQNGNCQDNYPITVSSPSSPSCSNGKCKASSFPSTPTRKNYNSHIPFNTNKPTFPSGCLNGECGGGVPSTSVNKPYYAENLPSNYYPQPSYSGCSSGKCSETDLGPPQDNPFIAGAPTINNSPKPLIPVCSNGQCGQNVPSSPGGKPYSPALNDPNQPSNPKCSNGNCSPPSPSGSNPTNYYPQPSNPANALQGKPAGNPNPNNYPQQSTPGCSTGQCDKKELNSPEGVPYNPSGSSQINFPQSVPSGCLHGKCGEHSNSHKLPLGPGCVNNNCGAVQPCANGKCSDSPNTPHQPNLPENPSSQDEPIYGGGFGGPSGILKPNDYTAPLPLSPGTPGQGSLLPQSSPNKPVHYNSQPSIPSQKFPTQNSPPLLDNQPYGSQAQANPHNSGNVPHSSNPKYPNTGLPHHSANTPHFGAASSPVASGSIFISGSSSYTGGFGGPPGYLKPFDDPKEVKPKHSELSPNTEQYHSVSSPLYGSGAFGAAGSYSGVNAKTSGSESTGKAKEPGCGGGCHNAGSYGGSGSFGVGGSLGLAKGGFDALIGGLSGAAASAKSLAGALAGTSGSGGSGSQSLSGSFAASSAVASAGGYKGGYGR